VLAKLPQEVEALGLHRVLVLCTPGHADTGQAVTDALGDRAVGVLAEAVMHVPIEIAHRARDVAAELGADGCVAVGGGSAIGLGKAIALAHGLPIIAVPTTYAGSEMTPVWGLTEAGQKRTGRDNRVLPRSVLYDPELTVSLPAALSAASGMNALAHAVEALYAPDASPILSLMAEEAVRSLADALPRVVANGTDLDARSDALYGAWLCGSVLGATTMSLHHKLCHALGGTLNLPHAQTHTVVLPHALAYNAAAAPDAVAALSRAVGTPRSLAALGMQEDDIPRIADLAVSAPYANPRPVTRDGVEELLQAAWRGEPPASSSSRSSGDSPRGRHAGGGVGAP
jgi:maleylacetate reductase